MVRISKKQERRQRFPRRPKIQGEKTGAKSDNLPQGFRTHSNAVEGDLSKSIFIAKIR